MQSHFNPNISNYTSVQRAKYANINSVHKPKDKMHKYLDTKTYAHKAHCLVTREGPAPQAITSDSICSNILISLYSDSVTIHTLYYAPIFSLLSSQCPDISNGNRGSLYEIATSFFHALVLRAAEGKTDGI